MNVYWRMADFDSEQQAKHQRRVTHTGTLTDEHEAATAGAPVLIEERSTRVYRPGELPPDAVLYFEDAPGAWPPLAEQARQAGFHVAHAEEDAGITDQPREVRTGDDPEEAGQPRRAWFRTPSAGGEEGGTAS